MTAVFLKILHMGTAASWLMLAVFILRFALRRAPKWITCVLWALVAVRLICPFSIHSGLSLMPDSQPVFEAMMAGPSIAADHKLQMQDASARDYAKGALESGKSETGNATAGNAGTGNVPNSSVSAGLANTEQSILSFFSAVWIAGTIVMIFYILASYLRLYWRTRASMPLYGKAVLCDNIDVPFVLGIIRPRIYLPSDMDEAQAKYVIAHEEAHIVRLDHWWKLFGVLLLSVYWFHPLCWVSYLLLCRDLETACDEHVVKAIGFDEKKQYASALLTYSVNQKMITVCPLSFGEIGTEERIRSILHYKKPACRVIFGSLAICAAAAVCFLTDPAEESLSGTSSAEKYLSDTVSAKKHPSDTSSAEKYLSGTGYADIEADAGDTKPVQPMNENGGVQPDKDAQPAGDAQPDKDAQPAEQDKEECLQRMLEAWSRAFVGRDGETIASLASESLIRDLKDSDLLMGHEGSYSFGLSSPWPLNYRTDCVIQDYHSSQAEICYYARTSEPHITAWKEILDYEWDGTRYIVTRERLAYYDHIASVAEYQEAYPFSLDGSIMDYTQNNLGESLQQNALLSSSNIYRQLFSPTNAAVYLLNLSPEDVKITSSGESSSGMVRLDITFPKDQATITVGMIQPYGKHGIWVPASYKIDVIERFMNVNWDEVENIPFTGNILSETKNIVCIGELPEHDIRVFGYNDDEINGVGVAVEIKGDVNYFDWVYISPRGVLPDLYWDEDRRQLQIAFSVYTGTGADADILYVLQYYDTGTLRPYAFDLDDYTAELAKRISYTFDEKSRVMTLFDRKSEKELASAELSDGNITGIECGSISGFQLGDTITYQVTPGYFVDDGAMAQYDHMPKLEFDVTMNELQEDQISFGLEHARESSN